MNVTAIVEAIWIVHRLKKGPAGLPTTFYQSFKETLAIFYETIFDIWSLRK